MKILSLITHPHVVLKMNEGLTGLERYEDAFNIFLEAMIKEKHL